MNRASFTVRPYTGVEFDHASPVLVIGAGACGLCAALAARDAGADVLVLEQDKSPSGATSMSTGLIPAAGTPEQKSYNIDDDADRLTADVMAKTKGQAPEEMVRHLARESAPTMAWLKEKHRAPLDLVTGFLYPGHSRMRMYGTPNRTGAELIAALLSANERAGTDILTEAKAETLIVDENARVRGVLARRPDDSIEAIGCDALILASCGFSGDRELLARHIPEILEATFHSHPGNKGAAIYWGEALGAQLADMDAYQGHGGLAYGHGVPILWPVIMQGGFQVNRLGQRFSDESLGYSEQAAKVLAQPGKIAWTIFDQRIYTMMEAFEDFRDAIGAGAIVRGDTIGALAQAARLPPDALEATFQHIARAHTQGGDAFGRNFAQSPPLQAPYFTAKVTGALFHTQGGLAVDTNARVLRQNGAPFANLFAGGGAARGVSGRGASGYIAGNGLWTATTLGRLAGTAAAQQVLLENTP
jgi:fumarate reductase flavoprotein subunit